MEISDQQRHRRTAWIVWGAIACYFIIFSYCIPTTCDDWYYIANFWKPRQPENAGIIELFRLGRQLTGRTLLWLLGLGVIKSAPLRVLTRTLMLFAIATGMGKLTGLSRRNGFGPCLVVLYMLLVPVELLRETYAWHVGFLNYVPPIALLLLYFWCIYPLFSGQQIRETVPKAILCLLLGVSVQLFSEPVTIYAIVMAIGAIVWHVVCTKKLSAATLLFGVGAVAGAVLMFTAPATRVAIDNSGGYYTAPHSLGMVLYILKNNYPIFSHYSLGNSTLLQITISVCAQIALWRGGAQPAADAPWRARLKRALSILLVALPVYFFLMSSGFDELTQSSSSFLTLTQLFNNIYCAIAFDALMYFLYVASVACVLIFFTKDALRRNLGLFSMASALIIGAPMLIVQPIPYRCFFASYLLWAIVALLFLDGVLDGLSERGLRSVFVPAVYAAVATVGAFFLMLYARCPEIQRARITHIERQMALHADVIVLPQYACAEYLHLPDDSVAVRYHYETIDDITFSFIPYDQWRNEIAATAPDA